MNLRRSLTRIPGFIAALTLCFSSTTASAGIPVIDAANLAQQIQQVLSWVQQYQQMYQQIKQMEATLKTLDGARNLGSIVKNPSILSVLPSEIQDPTQLLLNASATGTSASNLKQIRDSFGINSSADPSAGLSNAEMIGRINKILSSAKSRSSQLDQLATHVDSSADAKAAMDLISRNVLEVASVNNQAIQTAASIESARQAAELRTLAARQTYFSGVKSGGAAPLETFTY